MLRENLEWKVEGMKALGFPQAAAIEKFLLRNGTFYEGQRLPLHIEKMEPKQCYKNATLMAAWYEDLTYCEGIAMSEIGFPVNHAWCIDPDNNVIDPTWDKPEHGEYCGVTFDTPTLLRMVNDRDVYGLLADDMSINIKLMCELDPQFKEFVETVIHDQR